MVTLKTLEQENKTFGVSEWLELRRPCKINRSNINDVGEDIRLWTQVASCVETLLSNNLQNRGARAQNMAKFGWVIDGCKCRCPQRATLVSKGLGTHEVQACIRV